MSNFFQTNIVPDKPKVLENERVFVYVPKATGTNPGIAKFDNTDFNVSNGNVSLKWPMKMQIEQLSDPLNTLSRVKLLDDEFEYTNNNTTIKNPVTGDSYSSQLAELRLKRQNRNAFLRPDLVMLTQNDFGVTIDTNGYAKYYIKANNPFERPSLVKINDKDFKISNNIVGINWPYANNESSLNNNGYGLVKINSNGYLKFNNNEELDLDISKLQSLNGIKPAYSGNEQSGFILSDYVDDNGNAKIVNGHSVLSITKESVGLNKVQNKSFDEYVYNDFGSSMKLYFDESFANKLNTNIWNEYFSDWRPPTQTKSTPQKWFTSLEAEDESIRDSIKSFKLFLGYFYNLQNLESLHPADGRLYGCFAFVNDTGTYFSVQSTNTKYLVQNDEQFISFINDNKSSFELNDTIGIVETGELYKWNDTDAILQSENVAYSWYDTTLSELSFQQFAETDASAFMPDGVASSGSSGKWAQSDHIHPTDVTRLDKDIYKGTKVYINSEYGDGFEFNLWEETESGEYIYDRYVNIPYVRKSKYIHNWNGNSTFVDSENSQESYWSGTLDEYNNQLDDIGNNSLIVVDDEEFADDISVTYKDLDNQGLTVDAVYPTEKIVVIANDFDSVVGRPITIKKYASITGKDRYAIEKIDIAQKEGLPIISSNVNGIISFNTFELMSNKVLVSDNDGKLSYIDIEPNSIIHSSQENMILAPNKILVSSSNNEVKIYDTGEISNKLILSDGFGSIMTKTFANSDRLIITKENGTVGEYEVNVDNLLVSKFGNDITILPAGEILISGNGNEIETYDTGAISGKVLVSNGNGGLKVSDINSGKLLYTSSQGAMSAFPMSSSDIGKFVGVDENGSPTLLSPPVVPTTLPITTFTNNPGINSSGMVISKLTSDPGIYYEGVLYLW